MRIKVYIVTYKNDELLFRCLKSLFEGDNPEEFEVNVVNNYVPRQGQLLELPEVYKDKVRLIHNQVRSEYSTGHVARNWNECIIDAMVDITNPQCDILVLAQGDTIFAPHAMRNIIEHAKRYRYLTFGTGDECQIITPESIKAIGLFDERFCGIGRQEGDYFRRASMFPSLVSINDPRHGRQLNPVQENVLIYTEWGCARGDPEYHRSSTHHDVSLGVYREKWGDVYDGWTHGIPAPKQVRQYIMYPYFERSLPDLDKKYYHY